MGPWIKQFQLHISQEASICLIIADGLTYWSGHKNYVVRREYFFLHVVNNFYTAMKYFRKRPQKETGIKNNDSLLTFGASDSKECFAIHIRGSMSNTLNSHPIYIWSLISVLNAIDSPSHV